jgi:hypothetical protein
MMIKKQKSLQEEALVERKRRKEPKAMELSADKVQKFQQHQRMEWI